MQQILNLIKFELRYAAKKPATYIYALIWFSLGIIIFNTDAIRVSGGYGKVLSNAAFNIHFFIIVFSLLGVFFVQAIMAVPIFKDWQHKVDTFFYAYPLTKSEYFIGRFVGAFLVTCAIFLFIPIGLMAGEAYNLLFKPELAEDFGPFNIMAYVQPTLTLMLPNIFIMSVLFYALVANTRKIMVAYVTAISFLILYSIAQTFLSDLDNKQLASLLDPFGIGASSIITEYWTMSQKNNSVVPFEGMLLLNRILWIGISILAFALTQWRFQLQSSPDGATKKKKIIADEAKVAALPLPVVLPIFNSGTALAQWWALVKLETTLTFKNVFFVALMFAIGIYMITDAWQADEWFNTGIYPTTGQMLQTATGGLFGPLTFALFIFLAGDIVWREKGIGIDGIYDAFPIPTRVAFFAKLGAMLLIPVFLILLVPAVCIPIQLLKGYTNLELGLYAKTLLYFQLPDMWLTILLFFTIQNVLNNKFAGHAAVLVYYLSSFGLQYLGAEHPLFNFSSRTSYFYSDMNGFGDSLFVTYWYFAHWYLVGIVLMVLAFLAFHRGAETDLKARLRIAKARFSRNFALQGVLGASTLGLLFTGYSIYHNTVDIDGFTTEKNTEKLQVAYEKRYGHLKDAIIPKVTLIDLFIDLRPETNEIGYKGTYYFKNKADKVLDTVWLSINESSIKKQIVFAPQAKLVVFDSANGIRGYKFNKAMQPGDSGSIFVDIYTKPTGFDGSTKVRNNGTFLNNGDLLNIGYQGPLMQDEEKRKEYGLPKLPGMAPYTDTKALQENFITNTADYTFLKTRISTAPDQIAIAPGYLKKKEMINGRAVFSYEMDIPIVNFWSINSARYVVARDRWKDVNIEIYHHPSHSYNVDKMITALKTSLEHYSINFGPYQHKQVRILEFPRYQSFAQSFDNTIPFSESIGFIAKVKKDEDVDYVTYVTAHELGHQWWGHQVVPANTQGSAFLSETMSQYSALSVMKNMYGLGIMRKYLSEELNGYLRGRSSERKKEQPLMEVEGQSYIYYQKGSLVMFALQEAIGEKRLNAILKEYVDSVRFAGPPYTIMPQFYNRLTRNLNAVETAQVDDFIKKITVFKNKMVSAKGRPKGNGQYEVTFAVETAKFYADSSGIENSAPNYFPIDIGLLAKKDVTLASDLLHIEKRMLKPKETFTITTNKKAAYAGIDPLHKLVDANSDDNLISIEWEEK